MNEFPGHFALFNVKSYGARGDGKTLDTAALNTTIDACARAGGGLVYVPPGRFLTGTLQLKSNITLYLEAGAVLQSSPDIAHYRALDNVLFDMDIPSPKALIIAQDAENIALTGRGTVDGAGHRLMDYARYHSDPENVYQSRPGSEAPVAVIARPERMIFFHNCRNILIRDVTLRDSPAWTVSLASCERADIRGVDIINDERIPNSDGIHCSTSRNIFISDCDIRGGDDAIALTGIGDYSMPTEHVQVQNCFLLSRSAGIRVGHEDSIVRHCTFSNCVIRGSNRGIGVFARNGGVIENLLFTNFIIETQLFTGHWWGQGEPLHVSGFGAGDGYIQNVRFSNIVAESEQGVLVYGGPSYALRDLTFERIKLHLKHGHNSELMGGYVDLEPNSRDQVLDNAYFKHPIPGFYARYVQGLSLQDFALTWEEEPPSYFTHALQCEHVDDLLIEKLRGRQAHVEREDAVIALRDSCNVTLRNCTPTPGAGEWLMSEDMEKVRREM